MNIVELKEKNISELTRMAKEFHIEGAAGMRKQELMFALLQGQIEKDGLIGDFTRRLWVFKITGF
jgi:transcription termination factor Rho